MSSQQFVLPVHWIPGKDQFGRPCFYNTVTHEISWSFPPVLPPGWEESFDPSTNRGFFIDHVNKTTSWVRPTVLPPSAPPPSLFCARANPPLKNNFVCAGDRAYLVGAQDGSFPDTGGHVPGAMGGIWVHPIRICSGFWLAVDGNWLPAANSFTVGPFWSEHKYAIGSSFAVTRRQWSPDGIPAMVVRFAIKPSASSSVRLRLLARAELLGVWLSDTEGIRAGFTHAKFDPAISAWVCRDDVNPGWCTVIGHAPERSNPPSLLAISGAPSSRRPAPAESPSPSIMPTR